MRIVAVRAMRGFTLIEIMIAVAIIGILATIALPAYNERVIDTRRSDCMAAMLGFAQAMEKFYAVNYTYEGAGAGGADDGVAPAAAVYPDQCPLEGTARYDLKLKSGTVTAGEYRLQAVPVSTGPQAGDGNIEIDHLGRRFWDEDGDGIWEAGEADWGR